MVRTWRRKLLALLILLVVLGIGGSLLVARLLIAPCPRPRPAVPGDLPGIEAVQFMSFTGQPIHGWWIPAERPQAARGAVILAHPVCGSREAMMNRARLLHREGYAAIVFDFQAHGQSPGRYITIGDRESEDLRGAIRFVKEREPTLPRAVIGSSLGGASALLARPPLDEDPLSVKALVIEAVYPTLDEAIRARTRRLGPLGGLAARVLLAQAGLYGIDPERLRPADAVRTLDLPVLSLVGAQDHHTPLEQSRRLFAAAPRGEALVVFDGAAHVDLLEHDTTKWREAVLPFLAKYLRP